MVGLSERNFGSRKKETEMPEGREGMCSFCLLPICRIDEN
ncbi:hypothetical protein GMO_08200 [Gluconobacter morbifer G707]|uniref:Uncharacterized protein n=1 Tax=Gluconobacter morbifer G707 TaxID=1088869 RepID=G6XH55_9PROT|nr:hypothetical protein GMO_08200 [Gluconobacter morbifer G707]